MNLEIWLSILGIIGTLLGFIVKKWLSSDANKIAIEQRQSEEERKAQDFNQNSSDDVIRINESKAKQDQSANKWFKEP